MDPSPRPQGDLDQPRSGHDGLFARRLLIALPGFARVVTRYQEIERRLRAGRGLREIARALGCSRRTVREIRDGLRTAPGRAPASPLWTSQLDWPASGTR